MKLYVDGRWPSHTGIGVVKDSILSRISDRLELIDLNVTGPIGDPLSPLRITQALHKSHATGGVFWNPGFVPPLRSPISTIVTVHDLTHLRFYSRLHVAYYNLVLKRLYRNCTAIVCVSNYTRDEFIAWSGMERDRVFVAYNGVSQVFFDNQGILDYGHPYLLYPGNHRPYKNLDRVLAAFAASGLPASGFHLVFTGQPNEGLVIAAERLGISTLLHFAGRVSDEDLPKLYKGAAAVIFVSLYEGFGLPIIEAMASGVPVVTSNVSAMPEIAGDAAVIVDPYSVEAISHGMELASRDGQFRRELIEKGLERARAFDWDKSAQALSCIIKNVAA